MKRIISLFLCLLLILGLVSCKKGNNNTNANSNNGSSNITSSEDDKTSSDSGVTSSEDETSSNSSTSSDKTSSSDKNSSSNKTSSTTSQKELPPVVVAANPKYKATDDAILTKAQLDKAVATKYVKPKNVILMISDGMGLNDVELARRFSDFKFEYGLSYQLLPNIGTCTTNSLSGTTDSAAGGTALATGVKTINGYVGVDKDKKPLKNASEYARENGKLVGVVTNDSVANATPAVFLAHTDSRYNSNEIRSDYIEFLPDFLVGSSNFASFQSALAGNSTLLNKLDTINVANTFDQFASVLKRDTKREKPFFGFANKFGVNPGDYGLAEVTQMALDRLENDKGFFLMVENTGCDDAGHNNEINGKVSNPATLDKAVAVAIKYCMENPDTILIVTSDHETGGVLLPLKDDYQLKDVKFTSSGHTNKDVGVYALGYGTEYFKNKKVDNTDIGKFVIAALQGKQYK